MSLDMEFWGGGCLGNVLKFYLNYCFSLLTRLLTKRMEMVSLICVLVNVVTVGCMRFLVSFRYFLPVL